jgi:hypothetical protein
MPNLVGVEWWIHSRPLTEKMHFHFDRDEILWERDNIMVHPTISSILYVTDTGGATLILDQKYDPVSGGFAPPHPDTGFVMETSENCFVMFPGELFHGVLPAGRVSQRLPDVDVDDDAPDEHNGMFVCSLSFP